MIIIMQYSKFNNNQNFEYGTQYSQVCNINYYCSVSSNRFYMHDLYIGLMWNWKSLSQLLCKISTVVMTQLLLKHAVFRITEHINYYEWLSSEHNKLYKIATTSSSIRNWPL